MLDRMRYLSWVWKCSSALLFSIDICITELGTCMLNRMRCLSQVLKCPSGLLFSIDICITELGTCMLNRMRCLSWGTTRSGMKNCRVSTNNCSVRCAQSKINWTLWKPSKFGLSLLQKRSCLFVYQCASVVICLLVFCFVC